jgi:ATP-dependent protease ClpP protease subunit
MGFIKRNVLRKGGLYMSEYTEEYVAEMKRFNQNGKILVFGSFNHEMGAYAPEQVQEAVAAAQRLGRDHVVLIFDSRGGDLHASQRFLGAMHMFRPSADFKFVGYVAVQAASAAFVLLQHYDWRVAHVDAALLVHYGTTTLGVMDAALVHTGAAHALRYERLRNQEMIDFFARRSGKCTAQQVHALCKADLPLTPSQCLEYGFLDEVSANVPPVSVRPNYAIHD